MNRRATLGVLTCGASAEHMIKSAHFFISDIFFVWAIFGGPFVLLMIAQLEELHENVWEYASI